MDETVKGEARSLANKFRRRGNYKDKDGNILYRAAAVEFEDRTGLTGVAGRYKMPDNMSHPEAEYTYRKKYQKFAHAYRILGRDEQSATPEKKQAAELFVSVGDKALKKLNKDIEKLTKLNPELKKLKADKNSFFERYHAIIGITSQYNIDDINHFVVGKLENNSKKDDEYMQRMDAIKDKVGGPIGWTLSPPTLKRVEKQLGLSKNKDKPSMRTPHKNTLSSHILRRKSERFSSI